MPPELAEIRRWVVKAQRDRLMAEAGLAQTPPITDAAAFHCQQAVEKLLKAYLVFREDEFEKIHDLEPLADRCAQHDPSFAPLGTRVDALTPFAVRFRYPGPADPTVDQIREALTVVEEVWDFVLQRLPDEVRP